MGVLPLSASGWYSVLSYAFYAVGGLQFLFIVVAAIVCYLDGPHWVRAPQPDYDSLFSDVPGIARAVSGGSR